MRYFSSRSSLIATGLFCLGALGAAGVIAATPVHVAPAAPSAQLLPAPAPASTAAPVSITPHRAAYTMKLASVKNGGSISDAVGRMTFEWRDVCDGWAIQQNLQMQFSYVDGDDQNMASNEVSWEAKDGKLYTFNIRRTTNGEETEVYRGRATQTAEGSFSVDYSLPEGKTAVLPAGTLFPTGHTLLILSRTAGEDRFFSRRVFDGTDEEGSNDISAFILPQRAQDKEPAVGVKAKASPLLKGTAWPVHMAFFKIETETGEPDYEMDMHLLSNGVARHLLLDYGDFSITGTLEEVQALPASNCP